MSQLLIEPTERWLDDVVRNHHEEALQRVFTLLHSAAEAPAGCLVHPKGHPAARYASGANRRERIASSMP